MNDSLYIVVVIGLAATAVALRIVAGRLDRSRIRKEIARSGGEVLDITESVNGILGLGNPALVTPLELLNEDIDNG